MKKQKQRQEEQSFFFGWGVGKNKYDGERMGDALPNIPKTTVVSGQIRGEPQSYRLYYYGGGMLRHAGLGRM